MGGSLSQPGVLRSAQQHEPEPGMETRGAAPLVRSAPGAWPRAQLPGAAGRLQAGMTPAGLPLGLSRPAWLVGRPVDTSCGPWRDWRAGPSPRPGPHFVGEFTAAPAGAPRELWHGNSQLSAAQSHRTSFPHRLPPAVVTAPHRRRLPSRCAVGKEPRPLNQPGPSRDPQVWGLSLLPSGLGRVPTGHSGDRSWRSGTCSTTCRSSPDQAYLRSL